MEVSVQVSDATHPTVAFYRFASRGQENEITIFEDTVVNLSSIQRNFSSMIQATPEWRELQSQLSCQNRANEFEYSLRTENDLLIARMGANLEKFWCASAHVPCPTTTDPFRFCRKDSNGKVWGARVFTEATYELEVINDERLELKTRSISTSSSTSAAQDFFRDFFDNTLRLYFGRDLLRSIEREALSKIQRELQRGFATAGFRLEGGNLPSIPTLSLRVVETSFGVLQTPDGPAIGATVSRRIDDYPEGTGCYIARMLGAKKPESQRRITGGGIVTQ